MADLSKRFGAVRAVDRVTLDVGAGEFVSLLGPSGSGKTTLLMMIAGFEFPSSGAITISGRDMTRVEPNHRNVGMVFQRYALFPHMTVAENIAFPLRMRRVPRAQIRERVRAALDMVQLPEYGGRVPSQLSGGQQQRVALARAIVFRPPVILMDEPLGALDKKLREQMQIEIKQLQRELGATVIYVTHDQEEALTMSDRIAVMDQGRIVQVGQPRELYRHPASEFVADFLGDTNFLDGRIRTMDESGCVVDIGLDIAVQAAASGEHASELAPGSAVRIAVRPEFIGMWERPVEDGLEAEVSDVVYAGPVTRLRVKLGGGRTLWIHDRTAERVTSAGARVWVRWAPGDAIVFPHREGR